MKTLILLSSLLSDKYTYHRVLGNLELICILLILFPLYISGQVPVQNSDPEIGIIEKLEDTIPPDLKLVDHNGNMVTLGDIVNKPTVLSFVYFRCPGICSPLMDGLADVIERSDMKIGEEYQVLTISFDSRETTELAARKHNNYLNLLKKEGAKKGWIFMTADSVTIVRLTNAAGFEFKRTGNDFVHAAAIIVLSPERKITRYLNGIYFQPFEFKMALVEASKGKSGPTINRILQFCYAYDPQGKQYVLNITRVSGVLISFLVLGIFLWLAVKPLFKKKQQITAGKIS
jgi:protein SCO1